MNGIDTETALWYLGRGAGVVTLVLLTLTTALGVVTRSGRPLPGLPRFAVTGLHRSVSLLAVVLLGVHIGTLTLDPEAQLRWIDVVLPFRGAWRPLWIGLGTLAFDLLIAIVATSLLRGRIGRRAWRAVHWAAYALWPLAVTHGLLSGTDAGTAWMTVLAVACGAVVVAAVAWRCSAELFGRGFHDQSERLPGTRPPVPPVRPVETGTLAAAGAGASVGAGRQP